MSIWEFIETVYNVTVVIAYVSLGLWTIAAIVNIVRGIKRRRNGR